MRKIKFRAWDHREKKMLLDPDDIPIYYENDNGFHSGKESSIGDWTQLKLEQYTGLKDKTGKEIYEGDIIAGIFVWGAVGGEVYFDETVAAFGIKNDMLFDAHDLKNFEIKGNIHENPELIS